MNTANFYKDTEKLMHDYAMAVGFAMKGVQEVPDLKPKRELFVATLLQDDALLEACHEDTLIYYYNVVRYCLTAGIEYGAQWQLKPEGFDEENYDMILYRNNVGRNSTDITKDICDSPAAWKTFLLGLHKVFMNIVDPYLDHGEDASKDDGKSGNKNVEGENNEAVIQACFAAFQLGVSIALDKFDEPEEKEETGE